MKITKREIIDLIVGCIALAFGFSILFVANTDIENILVAIAILLICLTAIGHIYPCLKEIKELK